MKSELDILKELQTESQNLTNNVSELNKRLSTKRFVKLKIDNDMLKYDIEMKKLESKIESSLIKIDKNIKNVNSLMKQLTTN